MRGRIGGMNTGLLSGGISVRTVCRCCAVAVVAFYALQARCAERESKTWSVDGVERVAIVYAPTKTDTESSHPLVLAFHGNGATADGCSQVMRLHRFWPEAYVVYMQ